MNGSALTKPRYKKVCSQEIGAFPLRAQAGHIFNT
jgi:hypothetical protein